MNEVKASTTTGDALLQAILAAPDEDTPRLAYADWLDENAGQLCTNPYCTNGLIDIDDAGLFVACRVCSGEVGESWRRRAEFIRVQVELSRCRCRGTGYISYPEADGVTTQSCHDCDGLAKRRELELLAAHWKGWAPGVGAPLFCENLAGRLEPVNNAVRFARGFVSDVTLSAADWLAHADAIYWHPEQTTVCPQCDGQRIVSRHPRSDRPGGQGFLCDDCPTCNAEGRIHRPFVPTAHPITRVTLTAGAFDHLIQPLATKHKFSFPPAGAGSFDDDHEMRMIAEIFRAEWPHVEFTLS